MGQTPSIPERHWHRRLNFATNSLTRNIIALDDLSLHYRLSTSNARMFRSSRISSISRRDSGAPGDVLVAEWERRSFATDRIRMATGRHRSRSLVPLRQFLKLRRGWTTTKFTFTANDGLRYVWKSRTRSLKLYHKGAGGLPVAQYFETGSGKSRKAYIKLSRGCEGILDELVVTCIIAIKRRREKKKSSSAV